MSEEGEYLLSEKEKIVAICANEYVKTTLSITKKSDTVNASEEKEKEKTLTLDIKLLGIRDDDGLILTAKTLPELFDIYKNSLVKKTYIHCHACLLYTSDAADE